MAIVRSERVFAPKVDPTLVPCQRRSSLRASFADGPLHGGQDMRGKLPLIGLVGVVLLGAGCTTRPLDVFEEPNDSIIVGAKSRHISALEIDRARSERGHIMPKKVLCAEPSPDTASAIAQSVTAAVQAAAQVQPPQGQGQGQGAFAAQFGKSFSEGLIQMTERTQTIQLLRDSLYRACEAYANGALADTSYALILSRYDDTMVTMLTAELAAGAFGRTPGAISSEAQHSLKDLENDLKLAREQFLKSGGTLPQPSPPATSGGGQAPSTSSAAVASSPLPSLPSSSTPAATAAAPAETTQPGSSPPGGTPPPSATTGAAPPLATAPSTSSPATPASTAPTQVAAAQELERRLTAMGQINHAAGALMGGARVIATATR